MSSFSVSSRLTISDWRAYQAAYGRRAQYRGWRGAVLMLGVPVVVVFLAYAALRLTHTAVERSWFFIGVLIGYGVLIGVARLISFWTKPLPDGAFLGEWNFDFSPVGIRVSRPLIDSTSSWGVVREISSTTDHIFIWTDVITALVVPIRDLPAGLTWEAAESALSDLRALSQPEANAGLAQPTVPSVALRATGRVPRLPASAGRSIQAALRWLSWRRFDGHAMHAPDFAIALVACLSVGLLIALDRLGVGQGAQFSYFGLQAIACKALGLLGIGWLLWRTTYPQASWRTVLFVLAVLTLLAVPARWGADNLTDGATRVALDWAFLAAQTVYLARALRVTTGYAQARAVALSLVALLIGTALMSRYLDMGPLWYPQDDEEMSSYTRSRNEAERLLMMQPARIDASVASMAPRSGGMSFYMVGFAGVGEQKVFAGEVALAAKVIGDRYATPKRTLLLVNDQRDLESRPLASVTGLKLALSDIGKRMDRERDALIMVISSHGSEAPAISVSNGGIPLNDLTGRDLKEALDRAGIRWRIIIISACHAGAFIPYLRDPRSIVITAAAADRTSFGCSNDRDLTYFGEAFFRDALPGASSLRSAFETASANIAAREHAQRLTPSMPTAYFGAAIESRLAAVRRANASSRQSVVTGDSKRDARSRVADVR